MHWFYSQNIKDGKIILEEEEAKHALKVLRLKANEEVMVINGTGGLYHCRLDQCSKKEVSAAIINEQLNHKARPYSIHIAIAPTKNISRFEWFLEKSTEIGIDKISPILCHRSERKIIKNERLQRVLLAACKQSQKAYLPSLAPLEKFEHFVNNCKEQNKFIAHCDYENNQQLLHLAKAKKEVLIMIGPEGDFSEKEVDFAISKGFLAVGLGKERLRTETAGLVACQSIHFINQKESSE